MLEALAMGLSLMALVATVYLYSVVDDLQKEILDLERLSEEEDKWTIDY